MRFAAAAVLSLLAFTSPAASQPASATPRPPASAGRVQKPSEASVPFKVGETLVYDVSWSSFLVAATATTTVKEKRPSYDSIAYYVVAEGRPLPMLARLYNLYYKMDALVDSRTLLSQRGSLYAEEGDDHRLAATRFDRAARRAFFELQSGQIAKTDYSVPTGTQDGLAMLYALRARAFKAGDRVVTPVADGGSLYTVSADVAAPETVRVPFGELSAWNLTVSIVNAQGQAAWKNVAIWISNDARRLPVKLQAELSIGQFVLALREAR
jgi:Protein of unknown function (DUF3108)